MMKGYREGFRPLNEKDWELIHEYEAKIGSSITEVEETSAGCVVFSRNEQGQVVVLMIEQGPRWYNFPKGHLDEGEDALTAAIRETLEETGVTVRKEEVAVNEPITTKYSMTSKLHENLWVKHPDYPDKSKRPFVIGHKTVTFYCAFIPTMQVGVPQEGEALSVQWFTIEEANAAIDDIVRGRWQDALSTKFVQDLLNNSA